MNNILFTGGFLLIFFSSYSQDPKAILQQSYVKCQSIQNGYYEMTRYMKFMNEKDTNETTYYCSFSKLKGDSIFSSAFHYHNFWKDTIRFDALYTGDDLVNASSQDSTATIISKSMWASVIKARAHNYDFYTPLTRINSSPIQHDSDLIDKNQSFKFVGEEILNDALCFHIQVNEVPEDDGGEMMKPIRQEFHYWIKQDDYIPVQYSIAFDMVMNNDTMYQYEKNVLKKYEVNNLKDEHILTLNSIPSYYRMKDYVPNKTLALLKKGTVAPDWELRSLTEEKISLKSLEGQLVLIDFFYKSCYPCMKALPALQALHEKYKDKGLRVIGINPYDKKEDDIAAFLSKCGVTYTVLLGGNDVSKDYHIAGYPTMYLIDKTGKILFVQEGYGKEVDEKLDEIIKNNL